MIYVIAVTGIVSLIIGIMITQYLMHTYSIRSSIQEVQDFYTAEAGIKKALYYLTSDPEKGFEWRTGDCFEDEPIIEKVFYDLNDEVNISVLDDCGYLKIISRTKKTPGKRIEILVSGVIPSNLENNLFVVAQKPLVLDSGSWIKGLIKLNREPVFQGGSIDGILEINNTLSLTPFLTKTFVNSIHYFRYLLSTPGFFTSELFAPQVFSPEYPLKAKKLFVNDAVLVENTNYDSLWHAGDNLIIASTADVQLSGLTEMSDITILAIGTVKFLDKVRIKSSRIYSETGIVVAEEAEFTGVFIAPEIKIIEKAKLSEPSILYCGSPFKRGTVIFDSELPCFCSVINLCTDEGSSIEISERSKLEGFVYSRAPVTHRGEISGFVYCNGFFEDPITQDTTNTNIISGIIKPPDSVKAFLIPMVFPDIDDFSILNWQEF